MDIELSNRFSEVYEILRYLSKDNFNKIPKEIIEYINENRNKEYVWNIDKKKKLYEQNLDENTIAILAYINMEYLVNKEQKQYLKKLYLYNDGKYEKNTNKIKINEIFPKKEVIQPQELIECKVEGFFQKIVQKFKKIIKVIFK